MKETISIRLLRTIQEAQKHLDEEALKLIREFVVKQRETDGVAFFDKNGQPDLYYTAFGWLLSYALNIPLDAKKRKAFIDGQEEDALGLIHYAALVRCRLLDMLMRKDILQLAWNSLNRKQDIRPLSSFREVPQHDPNSPYSQFIWQGLLEDMGGQMQVSVKENLAIYHVNDGGYSNSVHSDMAYLNATAAALALVGQADGWKPNDDVETLRSMQESSGGFKASAEAPMEDLLSTATALFVIKQFGVKPKYEVIDFITSHWLQNGGFSATILDETSDVEYVFYGLLAIGTI